MTEKVGNLSPILPSPSTDWQTNSRPPYNGTDRQIYCHFRCHVVGQTGFPLWPCSREYFCILGCYLLPCSNLSRYSSLFSFSFSFCFPPSCLVIPAAFAMKSWRLFFCFALWRFDFAAYFHCLQSRTSFVSTLSKTKENQSIAHSRSLPITEIWILGCFLLSLSTLLRHIVIISAALSFCSIFFSCSPPYFLWSLDQFPFVSRRAYRCYYRPFLFSSVRYFFCFNPEQNNRQSIKRPSTITSIFCLANIFYCFQAR